MLNFRMKGNGKPLVFLHGFCEDLRIWDSFASLFEDEYLVCCPDLPGFGKSPVLTDKLSDWARACFEVLDSQNIYTFSLVGHSMGGYLGLAMMEQAPERIRHFVSFHSSPFADTEEKRANRLRQAKFVKAHGVKAYVQQLIPSLFKPGFEGPELNTSLNIAREQSPDGIASALHAMRERPDRSHILSGFDAPVLIVSGRHDALLPMEEQEKASRSLKKGQHRILEGSGHMGFFEEPVKSRDILSRFLIQA